MPALFTAPRTRVTSESTTQKTRLTAPAGISAAGQPVYTAEMVVAGAEAVRTKKKLKEPKRKASLRDRFAINRKAVEVRNVAVVGVGFAGLPVAYEPESLGYQATVVH